MIVFVIVVFITEVLLLFDSWYLYKRIMEHEEDLEYLSVKIAEMRREKSNEEDNSVL